MNGKEAEPEQHPTEITTVPISPQSEARKASIEEAGKAREDAKNLAAATKTKKKSGRSGSNFFYDAKKKTLLGRSSLNWGKRDKSYFLS